MTLQLIKLDKTNKKLFLQANLTLSQYENAADMGDRCWLVSSKAIKGMKKAELLSLYKSCLKVCKDEFDNSSPTVGDLRHYFEFTAANRSFVVVDENFSMEEWTANAKKNKAEQDELKRQFKAEQEQLEFVEMQEQEAIMAEQMQEQAVGAFTTGIGSFLAGFGIALLAGLANAPAAAMKGAGKGLKRGSKGRSSGKKIWYRGVGYVRQPF
jgi:hypothetical protein